MNMLHICRVYISHISMLLKILPFALYTSPLSVQVLQSRSCLYYVSYATTAAEVTWTVVSLTAAKFQPLTFPMSGVAHLYEVMHKNPVCTSQETHYVSTTEPTRLMLFREQSLFIVRIIWNTNTLCGGRMQSLCMLMQVVHTITTVF
jgi:hypothetical protein